MRLRFANRVGQTTVLADPGFRHASKAPPSTPTGHAEHSPARGSTASYNTIGHPKSTLAILNTRDFPD